MTLIVGSRFKLSSIPADWKQTTRPCGMNNVMFLEHRFPTKKEKSSIMQRLQPDECCIIFDDNDIAVSFVSKK